MLQQIRQLVEFFFAHGARPFPLDQSFLRQFLRDGLQVITSLVTPQVAAAAAAEARVTCVTLVIATAKMDCAHVIILSHFVTKTFVALVTLET